MQNFLSTITQSANTYTSNFGFSTAMIVAIFVVIAVFLIGITFGRSRVLIGLLSLYVGTVVADGFPYVAKLNALLPSAGSGWTRVIILIAFSAITFWLLQRSAVGDRLVLSETSLFSIGLLTVISIGFLVSLIINDIPQTILVSVPKNILPYFASATAQFYWSIAPIVALVFIRRD